MSAVAMLSFKVVKAVVLDWAGTVVDFGSRAPMGAFVEVFARFGVAISIAQARGPMGLPKRAHIAALLAEPDIAEAWRAAHGALPDEQAIDADDVKDDGSMSLVAPYRQPYDFVVSGDTRQFSDLLTSSGLDFVKTYADAIGPWKPSLSRCPPGSQ